MARRLFLFDPPSARVALTPLIDIAFLVLIFFMSLPLKRLAFKMQAQLPADGFSRFPVEDPKPTVVIRVRSQPQGARFYLGDQAASQVATFRPLIRKIGVHTIFEIHADNDVMWSDIVTVYDAFAAEECTHIRFRGTPDPGRAIRQAIPLPPPR